MDRIQRVLLLHGNRMASLLARRLRPGLTAHAGEHNQQE
jgi:hypothetical protein